MTSDKSQIVRFLSGLLLSVSLSPFLSPVAVYAKDEAVPHRAPKTDQIEAAADDLQYHKSERKLVGTGNVVVTHGNTQMTADRAEINVDTKEAQAEGHVVIRQGAGTLSGDRGFFNFAKKQGTFPKGRFSFYPWYGYADHLEQVEKGRINATEVFISSCQLTHPHWDVKAKRATVYPGDKIVAWGVTFRILEVPVFWLPYLTIPLDYDPLGITPGYSDDFGGYVLAAKGFSVNENVKGRLRFDWYSKRGFGFGGDAVYKFERLGTGELKLYGIRDKRAPDQHADNPFESDKRDEKNRGRMSWKHRMVLDPHTTLQLQWHEISDRVFLQDFFEREHREEIEPQTFATITRNSTSYSLLGHFEKRTNRFQTVAEKLPEVAFTWLRKPLFGTNFYYTNEEGFVNFNQTNSFSADGANTVQFYNDHELSYPIRFHHYNLVPFINFRDDWYTKSQSKERGMNRYVIGTGFDSSTRFYRTWDYEGRPMGIEVNGLRHLLEPIIQYNSIKVASVNPSKIVHTGKGDNIDHQDIITFGVENRIQTKRKSGDTLQRVDLVSFNTFVDFSFGPGSTLLPTRDNQFTQGRIETVLRPYDWLAFQTTTTLDLVKGTLANNTLDMVLSPGRLRLSVSHRFLHTQRLTEDVISDDLRNGDNQLTIDAVYALNNRWNIGGYLRWETKANLLEEWEVRATRDLHDWLLDFGFNARKSSRRENDSNLNKELFFQLRLKALPIIDLHTGHRASFSEPRIGSRVAGANEAPLPPSFSVSPDAQYVSLSGA